MSKINLYIHSYDNKVYKSSDVSEVYFTSKNKGDVAITPDSVSRVALLDISTIFIVEKGEKRYISTSGGILDFNKNNCNLFLETFEFSNEINLEKVKETKEKAEEILSKKSEFSEKEIEVAEYSLKKAINRLKIIK